MEDRRNVGENSCNSLDGTDQNGPIRDVYDDDDDDDVLQQWQMLQHFYWYSPCFRDNYSTGQLKQVTASCEIPRTRPIFPSLNKFQTPSKASKQ